MPDAPAPSQPTRRSLAAFWREHGLTIAALSAVVLGALWRLRIAAHELSTPLIDENEVVEQAVAFMGGDLEQHFVKYGPLTMYVLAGVYRLVAAVHGLSVLEYASWVFFRGESHYFIARALTSLSLSALALVAFFQLRRSLGPRAALVAAALLGLPCVDVLVIGARIDMPQAMFQGLALLALGAASVSGSRRAWLGAGIAAGLGIASKPLPGLLIAPCFPVASWFAVQHIGGEPRRWWARLGAALAHSGLWIGAAAALLAALLGDPAILNLREFIESQRAAVVLHSGPGVGSGQSILASFETLGLPFCALLLASFALVLVKGRPPARLVALFLVVYLAAFWGRSRHYFLAAAAVAACLLVAHGVSIAERLLARAGEGTASVWFRRVAPALPLLLMLAPAWRIEQRIATASNARVAREWIYANIPPGTRLHYIGWRSAGPPLVAHSARVQAAFGDHFGYGRENYAFLKQAFERGYTEYVSSGAPRYVIAQHHQKPLPRASKKLPRSITDGLLKTARAQKRPYIIIAGHGEPDVQALGYTWFKEAVLEWQSGRIAVFRVPAVPPEQ